MKRTQLKSYLLFKFYIPEYDFQSAPIPIDREEAIKRGYGWALREAQRRFLKDGIKPIGKIHPSHKILLEDGRITHDVRARRLSEKQANLMRKNLGGKLARERKVTEKIGWERSVIDHDRHWYHQWK